MKYYSQENRGFYDSRVHSSLPSDVIEITDDEYLQMLMAQSSNMGFSLDQNNKVVISDKETNSISSSEAKKSIDFAAGNARVRFIADGYLIEQEYALVEQEVIAWRDAGSPIEAVPQSISAWSTATGMTVEQAAQGIEAAAQSLKGVLLSIRTIRLAGKSAIDNASENFADVAQPFIDQLDQIRP